MPRCGRSAAQVAAFPGERSGKPRGFATRWMARKIPPVVRTAATIALGDRTAGPGNSGSGKLRMFQAQAAKPAPDGLGSEEEIG